MVERGAPGPAGAGAAGAAQVRLRFFASAREAAGTSEASFEAGTVAEVLSAAVSRFGEGFGEVLAASGVWVNGAPAEPATPLVRGDEVAVLPPVSGGCGPGARGEPGGATGSPYLPGGRLSR